MVAEAMVEDPAMGISNRGIALVKRKSLVGRIGLHETLLLKPLSLATPGHYCLRIPCLPQKGVVESLVPRS